MVDAIWKLGRYTVAAVALIQIAQSSHVFVVLRESAHTVHAGRRAIGIRQSFQSVTGCKHLESRVGIGCSGVAIASINGKAISSPSNERHGSSLVEFGD